MEESFFGCFFFAIDVFLEEVLERFGVDFDDDVHGLSFMVFFFFQVDNLDFNWRHIDMGKFAFLIDALPFILLDGGDLECLVIAVGVAMLFPCRFLAFLLGTECIA